MANAKIAYAPSVTLTQTNLDGIASNATWTAGWTSDAIDNATSNQYLDYIVNAQVQVESTGLSAGEIRLYFYTMLNDTTWPDVFSAGTEGTEGTCTIHDTEIRDATFRLGAVVITDTTVSRYYQLMVPSVAAVFGGTVPRKFAVYITQSTGTTLETTSDPNQVYVTGVYATVS